MLTFAYLYFKSFLHNKVGVSVFQVMHLEDINEGALFSNLTEGPYPLIITIIVLALDSVFYVLLAIYLDQVIPGRQIIRFNFKDF